MRSGSVRTVLELRRFIAAAQGGAAYYRPSRLRRAARERMGRSGHVPPEVGE